MNESRDSIADIWGDRTPYYGEGKWPVRVDYRISGNNSQSDVDQWVQSACLMCSNGCGMDIGVKDGKIIGVRGRAEDRVNKGRLGPKGLHCYEANHSADRLKYPLIRRDGVLVRASWDEAMSLIVSKSKEIRDTYTQHAIAFYTTGQLFIEEYYTLAILGKAGLGTMHMDGNTRLCTATAAASMRESFGSDGQTGSYTDIDTTECIFIVGHNIANTQTVLWMRMLDRIYGPHPPRVIVVDPRYSDTAKHATIHIKPRVGTNLALLNGIANLLIENNWIDRDWIEKHVVSFDGLKKVVSDYTPDVVYSITGVPQSQLREVAEMLGTSKSLLSTALQGVYQSNQATASACAINNIHLLRGMIGKPGCGIYQMNGQPTAQNNRETGCNGEYTGFRNWQNEEHMKDLAKHWNVDVIRIPHYSDPTHCMQMLNHIEQGSIHMFWIICTNPAVSLPNSSRVRKLLRQDNLFVVVQDIYFTETCELADVVLPCAMWGEKTGTFTNVDRTVHISHKAIDPPGEARSDFEVFCDYVKRMDFRDKDGQPLIKWSTPEECFEGWKKSTEGRLCDYTGMSYKKLTGGSGIQWPCNSKTSPNGTERLYSDGRFPTDLEHTEGYGHDLDTGAAISKQEYVTLNPAGRAIFKYAHYRKPHECPDENYPLWVTTGRVVYHFHTRTKTGRIKRLQDAAPKCYVQISVNDAKRYGIEEGDSVKVTSRRASIQVEARIGNIEDGVVFVPFHYGYWDRGADADDRNTMANELTISGWDPISKQPYFKYGAVRIEKISPGVVIHGEEKPLTLHTRAKDGKQESAEDKAKVKVESLRSHHNEYFTLFIFQCVELVGRYQSVIDRHPMESEMRHDMEVLIDLANDAAARLKPFTEKYPINPSVEGDQRKEEERIKEIHGALFSNISADSIGLLRELHSLYTVLSYMKIMSTVLTQTAHALQDADLLTTVKEVATHLNRSIEFMNTQIKVRAPQTLIVPT